MIFFSSEHMKTEVMGSRDFIVLYNAEYEQVEHVGRILNVFKDAYRNYQRKVEWAEIEPIKYKSPCDEYTENPVLLSDSRVIAFWRNVIME